MNGVMQIRDQLLGELELAVRTSENLIKRIKADEWGYQPRENMRTLQQLVHHLVALPATDLAILQEKSQPDVAGIENRLADVTDAEQLAEQLRSNYETLRQYFVSLSEDELLQKSTQAFYLEHGTVQIKWLIEIVTHLFHHRAQLYNYLKQLGHELHFTLLYG